MSSGDGSTRLRKILNNRHEILRHLTATPSTKPELVTELCAARSTIDRGIDDLLEVECITIQDGRYRVTATGQTALAEYDDYVTSMDALDGTAMFLNALPETAPLDTALLRDADVSLAESHAPDVALADSIEVLQRATELRGLAPVVLSMYPDLIADRLIHGNLTVEIVAQENVINSLSTLAGKSGEHLLESDAVTIHSTDEQLPYALWVMETLDGTYAGITAHQDSGVHGVLINDSVEATEWANTQYEMYRNRSKTVSDCP